jgi:hypothetical protein
VADVFRCPEAEALVGRYPAHARRVVHAITACRTAILGGHVDECDACGHRQISYNSCRDRHCPKCQGCATAAWVEAQSTHLLPVPYCHVVFTLPQEVGALALQNRTLLYGLLFRCASETLLEVAADPRHLGARIGFLAILHTWGQKLELHPHVHCLVPSGGIAKDCSRWVACPDGFFLPVRVLSRLFRGKYLAGLKKAYLEGKLHFSEDPSGEAAAFRRFLRHLHDREWVVYARPPFGGSEQVVKYLARYTHRVAISNHRLRALADGYVSFDWKDYAHGHRPRVLKVPVTEFARRFLLHLLPVHFVRIRYYGFLANTCRERQLALCRELLEHEATEHLSVKYAESAADDGAQHTSGGICPACHKGRLLCVEIVPPDTS